MSVTLKDIADSVGKSVPTVSRALAGYEDISPKTRELVQKVAKELGYEPNTAARQLQKRRTDTIALILPTSDNLRFSDPFFSEFLTGIVEQTTQHGLGLHVSAHTDADDQDPYLSHIRSRRVDGFILVRMQREDPRVTTLKEHNVPFVTFGRIDGEIDFPFVDEDGEHGIQLIVDHLISLGHTRLACIAEPTTFTKPYNRVQGFIKGLQAHNLPVDPSLIIEGRYRQRSGHTIAEHLLDLPEPPTALIACNDLLALGAMKAAQEKGLVIGHDVSITGFDDIDLAEYAHPPLTTIHQPAYEMGSMVAQTLIKTINEDPSVEKQTILPLSLVVRQSTGPVKTSV